MEITTRSLWTLIHGMGFGALYLLACTGAVVAIYQRFYGSHANITPDGNGRLLGIYLSTMAAFAWLTVLSGTYIVYPWYRAPAPAGTTNLAAYPRAIVLRYGRDLARHPQLRLALQVFVIASLLASGIAGFFGAMLDKVAPVEGGSTIQLVRGEDR